MINARLIAVKILNKFFKGNLTRGNTLAPIERFRPPLKLEEVCSDFPLGCGKPDKYPLNAGKPDKRLPERRNAYKNPPPVLSKEDFLRENASAGALAAMGPSRLSVAERNRNLVIELAYGVVRWQIWLDFLLQNYINIQKTDLPIINILRVGFYQILFLDRIPDYACCNEALELVKSLYRGNVAPLTGLVSGVLHFFLRDIKRGRDFTPQTGDLVYKLGKIHSHPEWIIKRLIAQYGVSSAERMLLSNNVRPKLTLRINTNKATKSQVIDALTANNIAIVFSFSQLDSVIVDCSLSFLQQLAIWRQGFVCVQDISATLCALLCAPAAGDLVVDLCGAPGGKTMLLSELLTKQHGNGRVICNDIDAGRLKKCKQNVNRMGYNNVTFTNNNALAFEQFEKADIVMLDAPCSGIGTIRKNVDIKYLKDEIGLQNNVELQRKLLQKAGSLLKDGGHLVYSVCSVDKSEGEDNIEWLLSNDKRYELEDAQSFIGTEWTDGKYLLTATMLGEGISDGAFAARLKFKNKIS